MIKVLSLASIVLLFLLGCSTTIITDLSLMRRVETKSTMLRKVVQGVGLDKTPELTYAWDMHYAHYLKSNTALAEGNKEEYELHMQEADNWLNEFARLAEEQIKNLNPQAGTL